MVPIRDPKLIGRKIDCPKCKYRFVVEEPAEEVDDVEEVAEAEAPAKKGKSGATDITDKKPATGKGALARRPDDDEGEAPAKKKKSGSAMLVVGISLAAVAVIALAVGAVFLFSGDKPDKSSGPPASANSAKSGEGDEVAKTPDPEKDKPKPRQPDVTNLLPNDSQAVLNLPLDHLLGNPKVSQAMVRTPGAFHEGAFQRVWGISPTDVSRVVLACNTEQKTVFSVMRTRSALKEDKIVAALQLKPEAPVAGQKYYLLTKPLDDLSTFLFQNALRKVMAERGEQPAKVALHFMDQFTVVCADVGPMNQFLQDKGFPKHLTKSAEEEAAQSDAKEEQPNGPGGPGGPPGRMRGMRPGGAPPGAKGGPAGGPPGSAPPGAAGGKAQPPGAGPQAKGGNPAAPPRGGKNAPKGQGGNAPTGPGGRMAPGMMPPGMMPGSGSTSDAAPVSSSYLTIDPRLKAVLDQVEKADTQDEQILLLSLALNHRLLPEVTANSLVHVLFDPTQIPGSLLKVAGKVAGSEPQSVGLGVTEFSDAKFVANVAVTIKDAKVAQQLQTELDKDLDANVLPELGLDFVSKTPNRSRQSGLSGGNAGMPPGGFRGNQFGGGPGGFRGGQPGANFGGGQPPGGFRGLGAGGFPGGGVTGGEQDQEKGKDGDYRTWTKDEVVALQFNRKMSRTLYGKWRFGLEIAGIYLRGIKTLSDPRSHIHDLAAAIQEYVKKEGHFPRGTVERRPGNHVLEWPPDQRLSWLAKLLPYLGSGEFQGLLRPEDSEAWYEGTTHQKAGFTLIPYFLAPGSSLDNALVPYPNIPVHKPGRWAATHFVGIAGVGLDAADYRNDDPATAKLRGVFGYDRETKKDDIKDGLEQTIVAIQVPPEPKSPWIAGGGSTVRGISDDLDCVRPFVCAKYTNKDGKEEDGTFAIMADGKVRFLPASIDPKTFQALCTIAGDDKIRKIDAIAPEVPPPEGAQQPELKTEAAPPPVVANPPPNPADERAGSDLEKLQGSWTVVSGEFGGQAIPSAVVQSLSGQAVFKGDKYTLTAPNNKEGGNFKLDDKKTPKTIDFQITEGKDKGKTQLGIYAISGDGWKLCVAEPGKPRPSDFATKGTANQLFVLKRGKPDSKDKPETPQPSEPAGQTSPSKTLAGWNDYTSKDGGFMVSLPAGEAKQQNVEVVTPAGKLTIHIHGVEVAGNAGAFMTIYADYPDAVVKAGADKVLEGAKSGVSAMLKGAKITKETKITVEGHPGREWTIDSGVPGQGSMKARVFLVKKRLIQLIAGGQQGKVNEKDIQTFFDSFKLTAK
jgi:uncharacterized protein (TIGR03067 family)